MNTVIIADRKEILQEFGGLEILKTKMDTSVWERSRTDIFVVGAGEAVGLKISKIGMFSVCKLSKNSKSLAVLTKHRTII